MHFVIQVPAAAFWRLKAWNCGELMLPLPSVMEESSLRISMLSFKLDGVIPPLPVLVLVFRLGILVGNFIFSFLLFSCEIPHHELLKCVLTRTSQDKCMYKRCLEDSTLAVELALVKSLELRRGCTLGGAAMVGLSTCGVVLQTKETHNLKAMCLRRKSGI